jgi:nicotinamidase-related amidase
LLIVDVQNDFISGSLALKNCPAKQDGAEVVPVINNLINTVPFSTIAYTYDWHPEDHCSFFANYTKKKLHKYSPVS